MSDYILSGRQFVVYVIDCDEKIELCSDEFLKVVDGLARRNQGIMQFSLKKEFVMEEVIHNVKEMDLIVYNTKNFLPGSLFFQDQYKQILHFLETSYLPIVK